MDEFEAKVFDNALLTHPVDRAFDMMMGNTQIDLSEMYRKNDVGGKTIDFI